MEGGHGIRNFDIMVEAALMMSCPIMDSNVLNNPQ